MNPTKSGQLIYKLANRQSHNERKRLHEPTNQPTSGANEGSIYQPISSPTNEPRLNQKPTNSNTSKQTNHRIRLLFRRQCSPHQVQIIIVGQTLNSHAEKEEQQVETPSTISTKDDWGSDAGRHHGSHVGNRRRPRRPRG